MFFHVLNAENYRLDTEYENHLIYKVALVMILFVVFAALFDLNTLFFILS